MAGLTAADFVAFANKENAGAKGNARASSDSDNDESVGCEDGPAVVGSLRGMGSYFLAENIAGGAFGAVRTAYDDNGNTFAVKEFLDSDGDDDDEEEEEDEEDSDSDYFVDDLPGGRMGYTLDLGTAREISALRLVAIATGGVGHPNIMPIHDVSPVKGATGMCMIMPKYPCSLEGAIKGGALDKKNKLKMKIAHGLLTAVGFLHANQIIHRDIKSANVLLDNDMNAVLADFSVAKLWDPYATMHEVTHTPALGTPTYRSPEVYAEEDYDMSSDVYAAGVVLLEVFNGLFTVDRDKAALAQVSAMREKLGQKPFPALLKAMLAPEPSDRPTIAECLSSEAFKGLGFAVPELKLQHTKICTLREPVEQKQQGNKQKSQKKSAKRDKAKGKENRGKKGKATSKGKASDKKGVELAECYKALECENPLTRKAAEVYAEISKEKECFCVVLASKMYEETLHNMSTVIDLIPEEYDFELSEYRSAEMRIFKAMDFCLYV